MHTLSADLTPGGLGLHLGMRHEPLKTLEHTRPVEHGARLHVMVDGGQDAVQLEASAQLVQ